MFVEGQRYVLRTLWHNCRSNEAEREVLMIKNEPKSAPELTMVDGWLVDG